MKGSKMSRRSHKPCRAWEILRSVSEFIGKRLAMMLLSASNSSKPSLSPRPSHKGAPSSSRHGAKDGLAKRVYFGIAPFFVGYFFSAAGFACFVFFSSSPRPMCQRSSRSQGRVAGTKLSKQIRLKSLMIERIFVCKSSCCSKLDM